MLTLSFGSYHLTCMKMTGNLCSGFMVVRIAALRLRDPRTTH